MIRTKYFKTGLVILILAIVGIAEVAGVFAPTELAFYDLWHRVAGKRYDAKHVVLVVIDEPTLARYRDDPLAFWTPHIAKASQTARLAGAKVIGLDMLFSISPEAWIENRKSAQGSGESYDQPFREEIGSGRLIQIGSRETLANGYDGFLLPHTDYLMSIPNLDLQGHLALSDLSADKDSAIRSFSINPALHLMPGEEPSVLPRFSLGALLALKASMADLSAPGWRFGDHYYPAGAAALPVSFAGPPGSMTRVSISTLLATDALQRSDVQYLRDKVVIIGGDYSGMGDIHPTPYSSSFFGGIPEYMSGAEIQANIVETLLGGKRMESLHPVLQQACLLLATVLGILSFASLTPLWGLVALNGMVATSLAVSYAAFLNWVSWPVANVPVALGLAYLGVSVLKFSAETRERQRIRAIFSRYVSDEVVDVLTASDSPPAMGGVKQQITVLFSDIRNFTTLSEKLDAHEVVEILNQYFERICKLVLAEGGTIDKFIGDAIMVQFGAPVRYPDHALRAIRTALAMREAAAQFAEWMDSRFRDRGLPKFQIGIGLHTGEAVVGNIGSPRRSEYTAIGDAVNLASRIEGKTKEMGCDVLISRDTLASAGSQVITGPSRMVNVKGRTAAVELFELQGLKGDSA